MLLGFKTLNALYDKTISQDTEISEIKRIKKLVQTFIEFSRTYPGYFKAIENYQNKDFDFDADQSNSLINKKEKYINAYYNKSIEELIEDGFEIILRSIKA